MRDVERISLSQGISFVLSDHAGDELFAKFFAALDEINFFKTSPAGAEDPDQLSKASQFFDDALLV